MSVCPISPPEGGPARPEDLFKVLDDLGITFTRHHHKPLFTVQDGAQIERDIPGAHCRNLFVRDKKETMFLVTALNDTAIDLKKLAPAMGAGRLSFGSPDRLMRHLGVRPGSVCPFAVMNDKSGSVQIVLDSSMMEKPRVNYHPLVNTMTIGLAPSGLLKFLEFTGHHPLVLDRDSLVPDT